MVITHAKRRFESALSLLLRIVKPTKETALPAQVVSHRQHHVSGPLGQYRGLRARVGQRKPRTPRGRADHRSGRHHSFVLPALEHLPEELHARRLLGGPRSPFRTLSTFIAIMSITTSASIIKTMIAWVGGCRMARAGLCGV